MAPLKVVALISGGKDSLFSILHCQQNGHQVVALANLRPPLAPAQDAVEDMDSYMYQTVGHKVIPLYEKALGLPLYRQEITGTAKNQDKSYGHSSADSGGRADETESLIPLLRKVKAHHPEVNAVSTGAILSDYQRTRVESVAIRLGLTPLSYLWQWPNLPPNTQSSLLEDMHAVGQDSRIIKVASGGLDDSYLWLNVADPRSISRIDRTVKRFGSDDDGAVLGEGGEYETLAVSGPAPLWKGRIEVAESQRSVVAGEAGSASLSISGATVSGESSTPGFVSALVPTLLEPRFERLVEGFDHADATEPASTEASETSEPGPCDHIYARSITGPSGKSAAEQMAVIMDERSRSTPLGPRIPALHFSGIVYVSITLRDMADFARVNAAYSAVFMEPNPPARITLAEPSVLPNGQNVMVSFTYERAARTQRRGLHVQSQSYWAPANIGPYSQAISVPADSMNGKDLQHLVYIAGQIPLVSASMELDSPTAADGDLNAFSRQTVLAAQHFIRIGRVMQIKRWACGIAFITAISADDANAKARIARRAWEGLHKPAQQLEEADVSDDDGDFDVWHAQHGAQRSFAHPHEHSDGERCETGRLPPVYVIQVAALPRGASIEWATYGLTSLEGSVPQIPHVAHLLDLFKDRIVR